MAKVTREERTLSALRNAAVGGPSMLCEVVVRSLGDSSAIVVAAAARLAEKHDLRKTADVLKEALARFADVAKPDAGCEAKIALVSAMRHLEADDAELYRRMAAWEQTEGGYGGGRDVASALRAEAGLALAGMGDAEAPRVLCDLLFRVTGGRVEDDASDRAAAARGLGGTDWPPAALLLRAKLHSGDVNPAVLGECCGAVARLAPLWAEAFVTGYLKRRPDVLDAAAVPLGETRAAWATDLLLEHAAPLTRPDVRADAAHAILIGLALTRDPRAAALLQRLAGDAASPSRAAAREALKLLPSHAERPTD